MEKVLINLKKKEILLFIFINSILSLSPIINFLLYAIIIANMNFGIFKQIICFICLIIFFFFKFLIFPFIYKKSKEESFYKEFFNKLNNDTIFSIKIILITLFIDILTLTLWGIEHHSHSLRFFQYYLIIFYLIGLGGLSLSYLTMLFFMKIKKYNISKIVTFISIIVSFIQGLFFIYTKGVGLILQGLLFLLPAIFIFTINYPFKEDENSSDFSKILIGILNFIILIFVQLIFLSGLLFLLN